MFRYEICRSQLQTRLRAIHHCSLCLGTRCIKHTYAPKWIFRLLPFIISLSWKHLNITSSIVVLIYPTTTTAATTTRLCPLVLFSPFWGETPQRAQWCIITLKLINRNTTTPAIASVPVRLPLLSGHPLFLQVAEVAVLDAIVLKWLLSLSCMCGVSASN